MDNNKNKNSKSFKESKDISKLKTLLIGSPNVGKSLIFNKLTGINAIVSNYPGTTVDIDKGHFKHHGHDIEIIDPPGIYSLTTITEEERISKILILENDYDLIIHVINAKNIEKSIGVTLQLLEARKDVILVINMMDEFEKAGFSIDKDALELKLRCPIILSAAAENRGMDELKDAIVNFDSLNSSIEKSSDNNSSNNEIKETFKFIDYGSEVESAISKIENLLKGEYSLSKRSVALLLLETDEDIIKIVKETEKSKEGEKEENDSDVYLEIENYVKSFSSNVTEPIEYLNKLRINELSRKIKNKYTDISPQRKHNSEKKLPFEEKLSRWMIAPITGLPILLIVLYFGLYQFVGVLGAGEMVDFIESVIFGEYIIPVISNLVYTYIPYVPIQELIIGDYGIVTLGITYAIAIILPIVGMFFLFFSILEDSGYLPRLALLVDKAFKYIGLNGRAVIPLVLGVGCGSMATMVTRTLETKRERTISTIILALTIPCSAQLGIILALLSSNVTSVAVWAIVILLNFVVVGFVSSKILPGKQPSFFMELPPLRVPKLSNVLSKTYIRLVWYFKELLPLFIIVSIIIWALQMFGIFNYIEMVVKPLVVGIGLPSEATNSFILGFFRRDYGAAGLYEIRSLLNQVQITVAAVTLTLFLPCVAQLMVMIKERGFFTAIGIAVLSLTIAFVVGFLLNIVLLAIGIF
ncbi:MAG: ferrous iron transport protein B [Methanobacteriaceae archaeon]